MAGDFDDMQEIINDFIVETDEIISSLDSDLVELDKTPDDANLLNKIFRAVHTIKGAAGFLGFNRMVEIVHHTETLLNVARSGHGKVTPRVNDVILKAADRFKTLLEEIRTSGGEQSDVSDLVALLSETHESMLAAGPGAKEPAVSATPPSSPPAPVVPSAPKVEMQAQPAKPQAPAAPSSALPMPTRPADLESVVNTNVVLISEDQLDGIVADTGSNLSFGTVPPQEPAIPEAPAQPVRIPAAESKPPAPVAPPKARTPAPPATKPAVPAKPKAPAVKPPAAPAASGGDKGGPKGENTIRVDVDRLDNVMNLVGELVLGRNRLMQIASSLSGQLAGDEGVTALNETMARVNLVVTDLQIAVMKTRMQPVKKIFGRFPRMVRDLAKELGKDIELVIIGEETELDKSVIEQIGDPLVHLIRNSIDHGVETPAVREAAGKSPTGKVELIAGYEGNNIIIKIVDDGKGMDPAKISSRAIEKGLVSEAEVEHMNQQDVLNFIFLPGFSTAEKVTDVSGRGVGMDVVKTNISKLNGSIILNSTPGHGSSVTIKLPLTVAIIQALLVGAGTEIFALPLAAVVETVRIADTEIQTVDKKEVMYLRDSVLSLVRLEELFDIPAKQGESSGWLYVVVIGVGEKRLGIIVERLYGQEEVVIKSLGEYLKVKGIAGATILGNGKVTLIVDLGELLDIISESQLAPRAPKKAAVAEKTHDRERTVMVVEDSFAFRRQERRTLEAAGYKVVEAENGSVALELLMSGREKVDLIITDIEMPEMNGYELTKLVKMEDKLKSIPVIAMSSHGRDIDRARGYEVGISEYNMKSDSAALVSVVARILG